MSMLTRLKTPVFDAEGVTHSEEKTFLLNIRGLVENERNFSLEEIKKMPFTRLDARLTSVSGWSVRTNWDGVLWQDFQQNIALLPGADFATFSSIGGYSTTVPLSDLKDRVMLVYAIDGEHLERQYGGPLRLLVPHLWGYKSCKWLSEIAFGETDIGGYWEDRGYTRSGRIEAGTTLDINTRVKRTIKGGGEVTEF